MLKESLVPRASWNFFQNLEVNCVPRSDNFLGNSVKAYNTLNIETGQRVPIISGVEWKEMGHLGQMVDNDPYRVMASNRPW